MPPHRPTSFSLQRGVIAVEAALLLPVFLLLLWLGSTIISVIQQQHRLHRATAALADVLANPPMPRDASLAQRIGLEQASWQPLFASMLSNEEASSSLPPAPSLVVTYINTLPSPDQPSIQTFVSGGACTPATTPSPGTLLQSGMTTSANVARAEWVMVQACAPSPLHWVPASWNLPTQLNSYFVALHK